MRKENFPAFQYVGIHDFTNFEDEEGGELNLNF